MTMWGSFSRSKEEPDATTDPKSSPSKKVKRRLVGRRQRNSQVDNNKSESSKTSLGFSKSNSRQAPQVREDEGPEDRLDPNETSASSHYYMPQHEPKHGNLKQQIRRQHSLEDPQHRSLDPSIDGQDVGLDESGQGIEILLDYNAGAKGRTNIGRKSEKYAGGPPSKPVISLEDHVAQKRKIVTAQFSVFFPVASTNNTSAAASSLPASLEKNRRRHRVPLGGHKSEKDCISYKEVLHMLQEFTPVDEVTAVRLELEKTRAEIDALEEDKEALEQHAQVVKQSGGGQPANAKNTAGADWDIHRVLSAKHKMSAKERNEFERRRGRCLTVCLHNPRAEESFLAKLGSKQTGRSRFTRNQNNNNNKRKNQGNLAVTTLDPSNCRQGGAGATIRHVSVMPGQSFFLSHDSGKAYTWGRLPNMLFRRMKNQGLDPVKHSGDLMYLSTGPCGYYYAEFRSGECWWGCAGEDREFYDILTTWDVYRVSFGSTRTFQDDKGRDIITNSWIILGRDGRAAWKNLPSRLHQTLESRLANMAAPAEVSLGSGDSYYVRFLDGSMDYCLPAGIASVCEHIQHSGATITDISLHPEVSHEFVVRHTEIPC